MIRFFSLSPQKPSSFSRNIIKTIQKRCNFKQSSSFLKTATDSNRSSSILKYKSLFMNLNFSLAQVHNIFFKIWGTLADVCLQKKTCCGWANCSEGSYGRIVQKAWPTLTSPASTTSISLRRLPRRWGRDRVWSHTSPTSRLRTRQRFQFVFVFLYLSRHQGPYSEI